MLNAKRNKRENPDDRAPEGRGSGGKGKGPQSHHTRCTRGVVERRKSALGGIIRQKEAGGRQGGGTGRQRAAKLYQ